MTLEKGKGYGQDQIQQTLQDKARTRLNSPAPHQAPQRERVSRSSVPNSRGVPTRRPTSRRWKSLIRPDVNMGVPQLMMILEPNIVWEHIKAFVPAVGKEVEASVTPGEFFEGWHKGGRMAHGVYEGSYWELMGDCDELADMLRKMSKAPALQDEPTLELPPPPELPSWDDFKPNLHLIPAPPTMPPLKLPPFRAPILETEVPFVEPDYLPVPNVPPAPKEEPPPVFIPPEFLQLDPLQEPQYIDPAPPVLSEQPRPPAFGQPKHGHDWSGLRPFQLDMPERDAFMREAAAQRVMDTSRWVHPPMHLPPLPDLEPLDQDLLRGLELEPIPKLELAWMGGPEPEPLYASMPSTPAALSRHSSRTPSRPTSALTPAQQESVTQFQASPVKSSPSRPTSALPPALQPQESAQASPVKASPSRPASALVPTAQASMAASSGSGRRTTTSRPTSALPAAQESLGASSTSGTRSVTIMQTPDAATPEPVDEGQAEEPSAEATPAPEGEEDGAAKQAESRAETPPSGRTSGSGLPRNISETPVAQRKSFRRGAVARQSSRVSIPVSRTPEELAWEEARSIGSDASGTPRMWLNFSAPFADLPPIMMPPRPEPGPEPAPADFPHEQLEELPVFQAPTPQDFPTYTAPPQVVPAWAPPCEPRPVGFLRGAAPVVICDVSGTMNPRQQGRFREMKRCAMEFLDPEGEIATAAAGFDVITFAGGAWSWSLGYGERMGLLQSSQVLYSGRQVGGRYSNKTPHSGGGASRSTSPERQGASSGGGGTSFGGLALMPTQPDLLSDAQRWIANWPDAVGQTCLLKAFNLAEQHQGADCWYILSDGLAHDQNACLEFLNTRAAAGLPLPVIHAVGFIPPDANPDSSGERFLRGLAELTGGSYQRYTPDVAKVWQPGQGFVRVDLRSETPEQRAERQWAERQLRAERIKNIRLGISEPLEVTMERVAVMHREMRVLPAVRANDAAVAEAQRRHVALVEAIKDANQRALAEALAAHERAVEEARRRNQERVDNAREAFLQAHADWEQEYLIKLQNWEDAKAMLERQRDEQVAAARDAAQAAAQAASQRRMKSPASRPTSAALYAAQPKSDNGSYSSPQIVVSEARAAFAAAEYDLVMGLERHADKLSPPTSRPSSGTQVRSARGSSLGMNSSTGALTSTPTAAAASETAPVATGGTPTASRPRSSTSKPSGEDGATADYLQAIAEDLAEASAPVDSIFTGGGQQGSGAVAEMEGLDDDGLDVRPSSSRRSGGLSGRDQNTSSAGRRSSRPPMDESGIAFQRPTSARVQPGMTPQRPPSARVETGATPPRPISARPEAGSTPQRPTSAKVDLGMSPQRPMSARGEPGLTPQRPTSARVEPGMTPQRPTSARVSNSRLSGQQSARLTGGQSSGMGSMPLLPEGSPMPPPLPEPSAPLQPMRGENSDDFKRRFLPSEVVEEHDANNAERLKQIREQWEAIVAADLAAGHGRKVAALHRNAKRMEEYRQAVYDTYAVGLLRDVVYGGAVVVATNLAIMDNGEARYQAEVARITAENARLREMHAAELEERKAKEEAHAQAVGRWQETRDAMLAAHEEERVRARKEHEENLTRLREEWQAKKQQIDELNAARLAEAETMHAALVESVKEANKAHKAAHVEMLRQRKEIEITNLNRLAEAKTAHKVRLEARAADNERLVKQAMEEHQALCVRLGEEYEEARVQAEADHSELCTFLRTANEQLTEEARRRYQEALSEVQSAYDIECAAVREAHARDLDRVRRFNQEIWPKVHVARLAQAELGRVQAFAEHIRYCANKFELGVNLMPNTPNYDRVVEMQALTEALAKAFPDMPPQALPWPEHERRLEPGTGWVAAPSPRPLTYRDPADIITKMAKGKVSSNSPSGSPGSTTPRGASANSRRSPSERQSSAGTAPPAANTDEQPQPQQPGGRPGNRPLSAGRARFAGVLSADSGVSLRPHSAAVGAASTGIVEAWATAVPLALSSPGGASSFRPQSAAGYNNPSAWRRSNTTVLRTASPRGFTASNLGSAAAAVAAAAAANACRPGGSARPLTALGAPTQPVPVTNSMNSPRPRSAGSVPRPARVAVDIVPLQASMARAKAQAGAHMLTTATLAGFSKDVPKLRYPEVDVQQPLSFAK
ncbi:hypothetical protein Agub_g6041 [Astrephomene gubernaculifera]|uniref:Uncharacterized protein n=1 Tax=Astrephomene gubernaculifera TaxID=47775 RepID=A0AAD3HL40_9CHLO|nr:hypothetical protein Agub_g6041 [Astrephomene gubernaculifera]